VAECTIPQELCMQKKTFKTGELGWRRSSCGVVCLLDQKTPPRSRRCASALQLAFTCRSPRLLLSVLSAGWNQLASLLNLRPLHSPDGGTGKNGARKIAGASRRRFLRCLLQLLRMLGVARVQTQAQAPRCFDHETAPVHAQCRLYTFCDV